MLKKKKIVYFLLLFCSSCAHYTLIDSNVPLVDFSFINETNLLETPLGKNPFEFEFSKYFNSSESGGYLVAKKNGFQTEKIYITRPVFGTYYQKINLNLKKGSETDLNDIFAHIKNAQRLLEALDFKEAHNEVDAVLEKEPNLVYALSFKAGIYYIEHKSDLAIEYYKKALSINPQYDEALKMLSEINRSNNKSSQN